MMNLIFYIILQYANAVSFPSMIQLTSQQNKLCELKNPCLLNHEKSKKKYKIIFETSMDGNKLNLQSVSINNSQKIKKYKDFKNFPSLLTGESFNLSAIDLNNDGYLDLALQASRSLKQGFLYYYFIFNPKSNEFILTNKQIEELDVIGNNQLKASKALKKYYINSDYQIETK
jgi:hypothetical protein